jgi:antitoxin component of RelBE/YafQ-DinJ toxin-antitoxin module
MYHPIGDQNCSDIVKISNKIRNGFKFINSASQKQIIQQRKLRASLIKRLVIQQLVSNESTYLSMELEPTGIETALNQQISNSSSCFAGELPSRLKTAGNCAFISKNKSKAFEFSREEMQESILHTRPFDLNLSSREKTLQEIVTDKLQNWLQSEVPNMFFQPIAIKLLKAAFYVINDQLLNLLLSQLAQEYAIDIRLLNKPENQETISFYFENNQLFVSVAYEPIPLDTLIFFETASDPVSRQSASKGINTYKLTFAALFAFDFLSDVDEVQVKCQKVHSTISNHATSQRTCSLQDWLKNYYFNRTH